MNSPFLPIGEGGFREWSEGFKTFLVGLAFLGSGHVIGAEVGLFIDEKVQTTVCVVAENDISEHCGPDSTDDGHVRGARIGAAVGILAGFAFFVKQSERTN